MENLETLKIKSKQFFSKYGFMLEFISCTSVNIISRFFRQFQVKHFLSQPTMQTDNFNKLLELSPEFSTSLNFYYVWFTNIMNVFKCSICKIYYFDNQKYLLHITWQIKYASYFERCKVNCFLKMNNRKIKVQYKNLRYYNNLNIQSYSYFLYYFWELINIFHLCSRTHPLVFFVMHKLKYIVMKHSDRVCHYNSEETFF